MGLKREERKFLTFDLLEGCALWWRWTGISSLPLILSAGILVCRSICGTIPIKSGRPTVHLVVQTFLSAIHGRPWGLPPTFDLQHSHRKRKGPFHIPARPWKRQRESHSAIEIPAAIPIEKWILLDQAHLPRRAPIAGSQFIEINPRRCRLGIPNKAMLSCRKEANI